MVSVLLGAVAGVLGNAFSNGWRVPVGVGLAVTVVLVAVWEGWLAVRGVGGGGGAVWLRQTGAATAGDGSRAVSGVAGSAGHLTQVMVEGTGPAQASGGTAVSGVDLNG